MLEYWSAMANKHWRSREEMYTTEKLGQLLLLLGYHKNLVDRLVPEDHSLASPGKWWYMSLTPEATVAFVERLLKREKSDPGYQPDHKVAHHGSAFEDMGR